MPKKNSVKKITIETLARITAKGFENVATKDDLKNLATKDELKDTKDEMRSGFKILADTLDLVRSDIRDLKISVEVDLKDLKHRVERLEKKVGLTV